MTGVMARGPLLLVVRALHQLSASLTSFHVADGEGRLRVSRCCSKLLPGSFAEMR